MNIYGKVYKIGICLCDKSEIRDSGIRYQSVFGDPENRIISPGSTNHSLMLQRMSQRGPGQMPPLSSALVDTNGANLIQRWIMSALAEHQSYTDWQVQQCGSTNAPGVGEQEDFDGDGAKNYLEYLTSTDPLSPTSGWGLTTVWSNGAHYLTWTQPANCAVELQRATAFTPTAEWVPELGDFNQPFYPASNRVMQFSIPTLPSAPRFYRARVSVP